MPLPNLSSLPTSTHHCGSKKKKKYEITDPAQLYDGAREDIQIFYHTNLNSDGSNWEEVMDQLREMYPSIDPNVFAQVV